MRPIALAVLVVPLVAAGCELTPRQQCEAPFRADLRTVEAELRDTRETLQRGFRLVPASSEIGLHHCVRPSGFVSLCTVEDGEPMFDKRPINRVAEQAKLDALDSERARLTASIAQCAVQFPE